MEQRGGPLPVQFPGIRLQEPESEPHQGEVFLQRPASGSRERVCEQRR